MKGKLQLLAGGLCLMLGISNLHAQETQTLPEDLQIYIFDEDQIEKWVGTTINGISDNGKYAVGHSELTKTAIIWDLDSRSYKQITGSHRNNRALAYDVSDDGTVVGAYADSTLEATKTALLPGYWKDGVWEPLPLVEGVPFAGDDFNGIATGITPDGKTITGYVREILYSDELKKNVKRFRPAIWIDGVLQPRFSSLPTSADETGYGAFSFHSSVDGKVLSGRYDHSNGSRALVVWIDGEITFIEGAELTQYFFHAADNGVSPNGQYVVGYFAPEGAASGRLTPVLYDTTAKQKIEVSGNWSSISTVLDDGTIYGTTGTGGTALIRTGDYDGPLVDYLVGEYGIHADDLGCSPSTVKAASADGTVLGAWYPVDLGFGAAMLPCMIVLDHPTTSIETVNNGIPSLRMSNGEISAEGAERIELYDVSGSQIGHVASGKISVNGLSGIVIAKAHFQNGTIGYAKFVVR